MLKSLMLGIACAYINPPGLQPNAPVVQATVLEILKQAYAMEPGTQKEIIIDHGDGLCSKVMIELSDDKTLEPFVNWQAWPQTSAGGKGDFGVPGEFDYGSFFGPQTSNEVGVDLGALREAAPIGLVGTPWPPGSEPVETTARK